MMFPEAAAGVVRDLSIVSGSFSVAAAEMHAMTITLLGRTCRVHNERARVINGRTTQVRIMYALVFY